jgi:hypothetical protein
LSASQTVSPTRSPAWFPQARRTANEAFGYSGAGHHDLCPHQLVSVASSLRLRAAAPGTLFGRERPDYPQKLGLRGLLCLDRRTRRDKEGDTTALPTRPESRIRDSMWQPRSDSGAGCQHGSDCKRKQPQSVPGWFHDRPLPVGPRDSYPLPAHAVLGFECS